MRFDTVMREFRVISMRLLKLSNDFEHLACELQRERGFGSVGAVSRPEPPKEDGKPNLGGPLSEVLSDLSQRGK